MDQILTMSNLYSVLAFIALMSLCNIIEEKLKSKFLTCCVMFLVAIVVSASLQARDYFADLREAKKEQKALAK